MNEAQARVVWGDALLLLNDPAVIPSNSVDALVTDPPYSSGGQFRGDRMLSTKDKYQQSGTVSHDEFAGDTRDQRAFLAWCSLWLSLAHHVVKPGGVACIFTDWRQIATTIDAFQVGGFVFRGIVPWDKGAGVRPVSGRFSNQCEYVVWGSKGPMPLDRLGISTIFPGVIRAPVMAREKQHLAGKPVAVMEQLLAVVPRGGLVLDPFCGSGSTGVACLRTGRRFIGFEILEKYVEVSLARLRETSLIEQPGAESQRFLFASDADDPGSDADARSAFDALAEEADRG